MTEPMKNFIPVSRVVHGSWKTAAIVATRGNQTFTGCLLLAILGKAASNAPRIVSAGVIDSSGGVWGFWQGRNETKVKLRKLCEIQEFIDRFRFLADHLRVSDEERVEMFDEIKKWISEDHRPRKEWDAQKVQHA